MAELEPNFQAEVNAVNNIPIIPTLLDVVCRTTGMGFAAVARVTDQRWITCSVKDDILFGLKPGDELKLETTICNEIQQQQQPVVIDEVSKDEVYFNHHTPAMYGFQSYISYPIFRKDGSFFGTLCAIDPNPASLKNPAVMGMFAMFADLISFHLNAVEQIELSETNLIKEREERVAILEEKNIELQTMNHELESFSYIASHDLQEPLRKIQTFSNLILTNENDRISEDSKHYFERMNIAVKRMQALIKDLFSYSKINKVAQQFETIDLSKIIEEVALEFEDEIKIKHAVIEFGKICSAQIIRFQFYQLFENLISNSLKFSKADVAPFIKIESEIIDGDSIEQNIIPAKADEQYCHIIYIDNGIGFDAQYSDLIFHVFQRLHGKKEYSGTGIGLAIVKKIVENHKGFIRASAQINQGARFDIYIPHFSLS